MEGKSMRRKFTKQPTSIIATQIQDAMTPQGSYSREDIETKFSVIDELINVTKFTLREHNTKGEFEIIAVDEEYELYCFTEESLYYTVANPDEFTWYRMK